jgi:RNA polymerase sigma factor (TIGR02999 family)
VSDVTRLLEAVERGEPQAAEELLPLVYEELRKLAAARLANEPPGQTLQPTALVHEAWLRLLGPDGEQQSWNSRGHFFGAAAEAMRRILVERARRRASEKHGGALQKVNLSQVEVAITTDDSALLAVDAALEEFAAEDPQCAALVKLRFFAGLTMSEAAQALGLSERSAHRAWAYARSWLHDRIQRQLDS